MKKSILLLSLLGIITIINAQVDPNLYYDIRLKKQLDSTDINYSITKSNNFKITIQTEDSIEERTQIVIINSQTEKVANFEIREIGGIGLKLKKSSYNHELLYQVLNRNGQRKIGAWEITEYSSEPDYFYLRHVIKISVNISPSDLIGLVHTVAFESDRIEKELGGGSDEF
jgi:hypothetical protein